MHLPQDVLAHDALGREQDRLSRGHGRLEALRTTELLHRWLPRPPATVLDVGGAAGRYALPLAADGYAVHLLDPVPLHAGQARAASRAADRPLASVVLGDARTLPFADGSADAVLLLGPLYHLVERLDRLAALREARRVLRPGGVLVAAAISRFASTADGICAGFLRDPRYAEMIEQDVRTGVHDNRWREPGWFATAWFALPGELAEEVAEAGLVPDGPVAVEGVGGTATDLDAMLDDPATRERVLEAVRRLEREPSLLGASPHLLVAGRVPDSRPPPGAVRDATSADAAACAAVYAPYVTGTAVSFESEPPSTDEMARRIAAATATHAWLVLEVDGRVVGWASGGPFRARPAWRWTCEVSVYVEPGRQGAGVGRALHEALLARLAERGYRTAVAAVTLPNEASSALHRSLGFTPVGTLRRVGWKAGQWHDVAWVQRPLTAGDGPPDEQR